MKFINGLDGEVESYLQQLMAQKTENGVDILTWWVVGGVNRIQNTGYGSTHTEQKSAPYRI